LSFVMHICVMALFTLQSINVHCKVLSIRIEYKIQHRHITS